LYFRDRSDVPQSKGHLNPGAPGVELSRFHAATELEALVRHIWVARWRLPAAEISRQRVLTYPTFNIVVMPGHAALYGPDPKLSIRELTGEGWAVGLLLRPAAGVLLSTTAPSELVANSCPLEAAPIPEIERAMSDPELASQLDGIVTRWLAPVATRVDSKGRSVNEICQLAECDPSIVRVAELARRTGLSTRSLERLIVSYVGVSPKWLIECRRLQEAATTLYTNTTQDLTELALTLQYTDYAHFSRRYKAVIGETPEQTRRAGGIRNA
jgi:AraC-like DNA-binding protein